MTHLLPATAHFSLLPLMIGSCLNPLWQTCFSIPHHHLISPHPGFHSNPPWPMLSCHQPPPAFAANCQPLYSCSCHQPLLAFTTLLSMVGCCIHACFALCSLPPAFIIASINAFVTSQHPLLLPFTSYCPLALITSRCLSLLLFH